MWLKKKLEEVRSNLTKKKKPIWILAWKTSICCLKFQFIYCLVFFIFAFYISIPKFIFNIEKREKIIKKY